jgi:hypothetical protein
MSRTWRLILNCDALAAFQHTALQNVASDTRHHTLHESMNALSLSLFWLVCSLRHNFDRLRYLNLRVKTTSNDFCSEDKLSSIQTRYEGKVFPVFSTTSYDLYTQ